MLTCIFLATFVNSAPNIEILTPNPYAGESVVIKISTDGKFKDTLSKNNLHFYEGRRQIDLEFDIFHYNDIFYLYAVFSGPGEYILQSDEILYEVGGDLLSAVINENITVGEDKGELLEIIPGIIFTAENPELKLTNKGNDTLSIKYDEFIMSIDPKSTRTLQIEPKSNFEIIEISTYKKFKIPVVYLTDLETINSSLVEEEEEIVLNVRPGRKNIVINSYKNIQKYTTFKLLNLGVNDITKINVSTNLDFVSLDIPLSIGPKESTNLTINSMYNIESFFKDNVTISYTELGERYELVVPLLISIISEEVLTNPEATTIYQNKTCAELYGTLCEGTCKGDYYMTVDEEINYCCAEGVKCAPIDDSNPTEKPSNNWVWGIIIFIALGIVGYLIMQKYKKVGIKKK